MEPLVRCSELTFSYSKNTKNILDNISLSVFRGDLIGLVGPNGVGKSTLLKCINGLLRAQKGRVFINGIDIKSLKQNEIAKKVAYVPQKNDMSFEYTVCEYVIMGRTAHVSLLQIPNTDDYRRVDDALRRLNIIHLKDRFVNDLSGGEQQKVIIARALVQEPDLILMDEPTSALDYGNQIQVLKLIRDLSCEGYSVIFSTHNPDHCFMLKSKVAVLNKKGHLEFGECKKILTEESISELYSTKMRLHYIQDIDRTLFVPMGL